MANTVYVKVENLDEVLDTYDRIKIYRSATADGVYVEVTSVGTRPVLNVQDNLYSYVDAGGATTDYYKAAYFHSISLIESAQSAPMLATPLAQLLENMQVVITVDKSVKDTDGFELGEDQEFFFTTTYVPMYSSIRRLRLDIGSYIKDVPDDTINLAIFEASREADFLTFDKTTAATNGLYKHARRQWTTCKAAEILLNNIINGAGGLVKSKRLADFAVEYDTKAIENILSKVKDCIARWEAEVNTGGFAIASPKGVVKGEYDLDRPNAGRGWDDPDGWPLGNGKVQYSGSRRWLTTYVPKKRGGDD